MAYTKLNQRITPDARVEEISPGSAYRLFIPSGTADKYRFAQLDDYAQTPRARFLHRAGIHLSLSARTSSDSIAGTWGFGLWNDPFGLSLGFGGNSFRLPALPNAVWFFGASKENYLSFKCIRPERSRRSLAAQSTLAPRSGREPVGARRPGVICFANHAGEDASTTDIATNAQSSAQRGIAANGFIAQVFRSPKFHPLLIPAGFALPFSRKRTRQLLGKVIAEDGIDLSRGDRPIAPTDWHKYSLDWRETRVSFRVDDAVVLESSVSPHPPLGLVIWIDNQYAAFTPDGKIGFGVLANDEAWLEIKDLELKTAPGL